MISILHAFMSLLLLVLIPGDDGEDDNDDADDDDDAVLNLRLLLSRRSSLSDYEKGNKKREKVQDVIA